MNFVRLGTIAIAISGVLVACGGGSGAAAGHCGPPPASPHPQLWLVYPMPGATQVPVAMGALVFADIGGLTQKDSVALSAAGTSVPVGQFTTAPSPLPSPRVTPGAQFGGAVPYVSVSVPTLSASTTYTVQYTYQDWADNPPACTTVQTQTLGTFTTQ